MATNVAPTSPSLGVGRFLRYGDVLLAVGVVTVMVMLVVPLPSWVLDVLLTANLALSLLVLMLSLYIQQPLQFSVFPSVLLIATLFRLGLNVSSTRLILLHAEAGKVIDAFGKFVMGGDYVVGLVVFFILVIIQFVVITNGAGRVAEVAARFTLDAMPGKQMSIDADLNAGLIGQDDARRRRRAIEQEADFYGSMDGASKFIRGDAIAGIIIIAVNIVGGFAIGVFQRDMMLGSAAQTYTLLTVGDGLVSQIPALLISTATGIIVTRAASDSSLGQDMTGQVLARPRALLVAGGLLLALGMVSGLPTVPFFLVGSMLVGTAYLLRTNDRLQDVPAGTDAEIPEPSNEPEDVAKLLPLDPIELEVGYGLIPLVDAERGGSLLSRISLLRHQVALDLGIILPTVRIRDNLRLERERYQVKLRGVVIAHGEVRVDRYLAMNASLVAESLEGIPTQEPVFGLPALWIIPEAREQAELLGYTVVDPASVITTHLTEVVRSHASSVLSRQDVRTLLNNLKAEAPAVVEDLVPELLSVGEVQQVLQNLLRERVSVRDLVTVLEALANVARTTRDPEALSEQARQALGPSICAQYADPNGVLRVFTLSPRLQQAIADGLHPSEQGLQVTLEPALSQAIVHAIARDMERLAAAGHQPVLLCPARIRLPLRRLLERALPNLAVLSYGEAVSHAEIQTTGMVDLPEVGGT